MHQVTARKLEVTIALRTEQRTKQKQTDFPSSLRGSCQGGFLSRHVGDSCVPPATRSAGWASGAVTARLPDAHAETAVAAELPTPLAGPQATPGTLSLQASWAPVSDFLAFPSYGQTLGVQGPGAAYGVRGQRPCSDSELAIAEPLSGRISHKRGSAVFVKWSLHPPLRRLLFNWRHLQACPETFK